MHEGTDGVGVPGKQKGQGERRRARISCGGFTGSRWNVSAGGSTSYVLEFTYKCGSRLRTKAYEEAVSGGEAWGSCKPSPESPTAPERLSVAVMFRETTRFEDVAASLPDGSAVDSPSFILNR